MSVTVECPNRLGEAKPGDIVCIPAIGLVAVLNKKDSLFSTYRVISISSLVHINADTDVQSFELSCETGCILYDVTLTPRNSIQ